MVRKQDQIYGCLLGAAAGDALGFCVEDLTLADIREKYGPGGIQGYDTVNGFATISSHTQLSMFTANGLLLAPPGSYPWRHGALCAVSGGSLQGLEQNPTLRQLEKPGKMLFLAMLPGGAVQPPQSGACCPVCPGASPRRNHRRAGQPLPGPQRPGRCAPIGLFLSPQETPPFEISLLGAESAALTHGDPLGFLPAAYLTDLLSRIVYGKPESFRSILKKTRTAMIRQFEGRFSQVHIIENSLDWAEAAADTAAAPGETLSQQRPTDASSILACACYVCLKYPGDYDRGIVAAVNHSGLSSALGAVTGALLGAQVGTEGIPEFYLEPLELREPNDRAGQRPVSGCPMSRSARLFDDQWEQKYIQCSY